MLVFLILICWLMIKYKPLDANQKKLNVKQEKPNTHTYIYITSLIPGCLSPTRDPFPISLNQPQAH